MLTRTIVQVGHDLGIEIVAEGIERPEQLELLRAMGCGLGQGFLLAPPMPASGIEALLGEHAEREGQQDQRDRDRPVAADARSTPEPGPAPDAAAAAPAG
jgi:predicted signal transduction protein with EAL and GGDEF domain